LVPFTIKVRVIKISPDVRDDKQRTNNDAFFASPKGQETETRNTGVLMTKTKQSTASGENRKTRFMSVPRRTFMQLVVPAACFGATSTVAFPRNDSPRNREADGQGSQTASEAGAQRLALSKLRSWEELKYGMFICFGMSTFLDEKIPGRAPNSTYNPDKLDVDQWIQIARDAGMKYAVLTAKHNPGHCLWPSHHGDLNIAHSPNKTDVVEAFMKSCERRGILPGLFYNSYDNGNLFGQVNKSPEGFYPWQEKGRKTTYSTSAYQDFQTAQVTELLTQYGTVREVWIDIPQLLGHGYRTFLYEHIAKLQRDAVIIMNGMRLVRGKLEPSLDSAWPTDLVGYERTLPPASGHVKWREIEGRRYYLPGEFYSTIGKEWFYFEWDHPRSDQDLLMELLECRKRGVNFLFDVPPDRHGLIPEASRDALMRLRKNANI
jgi:alpha-L-fucosidase